jgi:ferritin
MPAEQFVSALNEQIGREFGASQQYAAVAVYFDDLALPQLAAFFYRQSLEERDHAMMMVQYLLDADEKPVVPGVDPPKVDFGDLVEPVRIALDQEKRVTDQISALWPARPTTTSRSSSRSGS